MRSIYCSLELCRTRYDRCVEHCPSRFATGPELASSQTFGVCYSIHAIAAVGDARRHRSLSSKRFSVPSCLVHADARPDYFAFGMRLLLAASDQSFAETFHALATEHPRVFSHYAFLRTKPRALENAEVIKTDASGAHSCGYSRLVPGGAG